MNENFFYWPRFQSEVHSNSKMAYCIEPENLSHEVLLVEGRFTRYDQICWPDSNREHESYVYFDTRFTIDL